MRKILLGFLMATLFMVPLNVKGSDPTVFQTRASDESTLHNLRISGNLILWLATVPNLGVEYTTGRHWSLQLNVIYSPWNITDKYALKTVAIFPEMRWWYKSNNKGSFWNIHLDVAWYNARFNEYRYQDTSRPLVGVGVGYGYRWEFNEHWGLEFEIGAGVANTKYNRYYNINNGALKDTRVSTYLGLDRLALTLSYNLSGI